MSTEIEDKVAKWKAMDGEIQELFKKKTASLAQFNENTLVKGELDLISEENADTVYKLVGPVLMNVDLDESKTNVTKRIEFIEQEIKKFDAYIEGLQGDQATLGDEIQNAQMEMQKNAAEEAQKIAAEATAAS
jgi:prefoldin beta subunit